MTRRIAIAGMIAAMLINLIPPLYANGYGYCGGYGYSAPSYYTPTYYSPPVYNTPSYANYTTNNYYQKVEKRVQPVVIQENLVPAYVFQVLSAYAPTNTTTVQTTTTQTTPVAAATTPTPIQSQAATGFVAQQQTFATQQSATGQAAVAVPQATVTTPVVAQTATTSCVNLDEATLERLAAMLSAKMGTTAPVDLGGMEPPTLQLASDNTLGQMYPPQKEYPSTGYGALPTPQGGGILGQVPPPPPVKDGGQGIRPQLPPPTPQPPQELLSSHDIQALGNACYKCHNAAGMTTGVKPKGNVILFNAQQQFAPAKTNGQPLPKATIYEAVAYTDQDPPHMPPGADLDPTKRLPPDVVEKIRLWALQP